jgi:hypothetical protein
MQVIENFVPAYQQQFLIDSLALFDLIISL